MAENTPEKSRDQQINDLATRVATEFKAVKALIPDANTFIPKTGNREELAGWQQLKTPLYQTDADGVTALVIGANAPDAMELTTDPGSVELVISGNKFFGNSPYNGETYTLDYRAWWVKTLTFKVVPYYLKTSFAQQTVWIGGEAPTIEANDTLVMLWDGATLFLNLLKANPS